MKLKLDANGAAVLTDGKPTYIKDDGSEIAFDGAQAFAKIGQLTGENTAYKTRFTEAETKLKSFEGIEDPEAAKAALVTVANIKDGELISAGKAEEIKAKATKAAEDAVAAAKTAHAAEVAALTTERDTFKGQLYEEKVGGAFARSKFIAEKVATPPHMLEKTYGSHFKIEDGRIVPYDAAGNKIGSSKTFGEDADFEEAIEKLIMADPYKDRILKGTGNSGSGAQPGNGKVEGDVSAMSPQQKMAAGRAAASR
jgi:hypothetical protein